MLEEIKKAPTDFYSRFAAWYIEGRSIQDLADLIYTVMPEDKTLNNYTFVKSRYGLKQENDIIMRRFKFATDCKERRSTMLKYLRFCEHENVSAKSESNILNFAIKNPNVRSSPIFYCARFLDIGILSKEITKQRKLNPAPKKSEADKKLKVIKELVENRVKELLEVKNAYGKVYKEGTLKNVAHHLRRYWKWMLENGEEIESYESMQKFVEQDCKRKSESTFYQIKATLRNYLERTKPININKIVDDSIANQ